MNKYKSKILNIHIIKFLPSCSCQTGAYTTGLMQDIKTTITLAKSLGVEQELT